MSRFTVDFYDLPNGMVPMKLLLDAMDAKLAAKVARDLELLETFGPALREPQSKYLRDGIFELRTRQSTNHVRSFYFFHHDSRIIVTHGIIKQQRRTPSRDIRQAIAYKLDWEGRHL